MRPSRFGWLVLLSCPALLSLDNPVARADDPADAFKANSVWNGTFEQSKPKQSDAMVLFVKERRGDTFEALAWYPSLNSGVTRLTGQIGEKGVVTFTEDRVIHGASVGGGSGVIAGTKYTGKLDGSKLTGTGEFATKKKKEVITATFSLKLAE